MTILISKLLNERYNKSLINISELVGGWSAKAFKVETNDGIFFLKVYDKEKASTQIWTAAIDTYMPIVVWLNNNTELKDRIICPILSNSGEYKYEDEKFVYLLFPYIEGYTLGKKPMSNQQMLLLNIDKVEKLSVKLSKETLPFVLCHTDVHGWNLMQSDRLILIDWECMKLAPTEADLFAFIGNLFWHNCSDEFLKTYQSVHIDYEINLEVLEFYLARRRIEDICAIAQGLLYEKNIDDTERKESLYHLQHECEALSK